MVDLITATLFSPTNESPSSTIDGLNPFGVEGVGTAIKTKSHSFIKSLFGK